jgi:hypothetical protein
MLNFAGQGENSGYRAQEGYYYDPKFHPAAKLSNARCSTCAISRAMTR